MTEVIFVFFFFSSRRRHTRFSRDWSSDVCSSDLLQRSWRGWPGWRVDLAVALLAAVIQVGGTYMVAQYHHQGYRPLDGVAYTLLAAGPAALIARRRHPSAVLAVIMSATLLYWVGFGHPLGYPRGPVFVALVIAFFTVAVRGSRWVPWVAVAAGWLG